MILSVDFLVFFSPAAGALCVSLVCSDVFQAEYPILSWILYRSLHYIFFLFMYGAVAMA